MEMLKILWPTEDEAKIIACFEVPLMDLKGPRRISKLTGIPPEKVSELCEIMAKRGVILRQGKQYALLPIMPGLYEFYFISKTDSQENLEKVAELFHDVVNSGLLNEWYSSDYPFFRILPSSSVPQKTIKCVEIDETIKAEHEILIFEDVAKYIQQAKSITVVNCACRTTFALIGDKCEKPMDICMALNIASDALNSYNLGRKINQEEALNLLKLAEDSGLVHTIINGASAEAGMLICNCCSCHCGVLSGLIKFNNPRSFAKSNFRPEINAEVCKKCEKCIKVCPMTAIWHHFPHGEDLSDNFIVITDRCIGCGLCAHHCPNNAIGMKKIYTDLPEATLPGVLQKAEGSRSH